MRAVLRTVFNNTLLPRQTMYGLNPIVAQLILKDRMNSVCRRNFRESPGMEIRIVLLWIHPSTLEFQRVLRYFLF